MYGGRFATFTLDREEIREGQQLVGEF